MVIVGHTDKPALDGINPPLDNQEFAAFCKDPDGWNKKLKNSNNFFTSKEKEPVVKVIPHDEQEESKSSIDQPFLDEGLTGQP